MQLPDDISRRAALNPTQSMIVTAPAGSGKTELLIRRFLTLLCGVNQPEEILCITFTRKAAFEMRQRIINAILFAKSNPDIASDNELHSLAKKVCLHEEKQQWHILENPERLKIQTIDSFCGSLVRKFPMTTLLGSSLAVADQPIQLYQLAVRQLLSLLEENTEISDNLANLISHLDNDLNKLSQLLIQLLAKRDQWLPHINVDHELSQVKKYLEAVLCRLVTEKLTKAHQLLSPFAMQICALLEYAIENLKASDPEHCLIELDDFSPLPDTQAQQLYQWKLLTQFLLTQNGSWRKSVNKNVGFPTECTTSFHFSSAKEAKMQFMLLLDDLSQVVDLNAVLNEINQLPEANYQPRQWDLLKSLTQILPHLVAHLKITFQEQGYLDHQEIAILAHDLLSSAENTDDLLLHFDNKISHILVDEYQDTSPLQVNILKALISPWQSGDGKTLFLVGDALQSCYGFRSANVGLFLAAQQYGVGDLKLQSIALSSNFRSHETIVNWVNQIFAQAFPTQQDITLGAMPYYNAVPIKKDEGNEAVVCIALDEEAPSCGEADLIVRQIKQHQVKHPDDRIAILVRNRGHLQTILPQLSQANIAWLCHDIDRLADKPIIQDLVILLRATLNYSDRLAWVALLRTPWFGLMLSDIFKLTNYQQFDRPVIDCLNDSSLHMQLSVDAKNRLEHILPILNQLLALKQHMPLSTWLYQIWQKLQGEIVISSYEMDDVQQFFTLLAEYDVVGDIADIQSFMDILQTITTTSRDVSAQVQVMTMHKSKGLEFDVVFIPGLERRPRVDAHELLLWQERINVSGETQLLLSPISPSHAEEDLLYRYIRSQKQQSQLLENTRLLYIGITRAIKNVYLLARVNKTAEGKLVEPDKRSLLYSIWPQFQAQMHYPKTEQAESVKQASAPLQSMKRFKLSVLEKMARKPHAIPPLKQAHITPLSIAQISQMHIGTVIHLTLMKLSQDNMQSTDTLDSFVPFWQAKLQQLGLMANQEQIQTIQQSIKKVVSDTTGCWILQHNHRENACEYPITYYQQGELKRYVIDRTFVDETNCRWIIDYKTVAFSKRFEIETQIKAEVDKHRSQLVSYYHAFSLFETRQIRLGLYFTDVPAFVEIDAETPHFKLLHYNNSTLAVVSG